MSVPNLDHLLRTAIKQTRLLRLCYRNKDRIVEPHDYGQHNGVIKLLTWQIGGSSSAPLPNWRWIEIDQISDAQLLDQTFSEARPPALANTTNGTSSSSESNRLTITRREHLPSALYAPLPKTHEETAQRSDSRRPHRERSHRRCHTGRAGDGLVLLPRKQNPFPVRGEVNRHRRRLTAPQRRNRGSDSHGTGK